MAVTYRLAVAGDRPGILALFTPSLLAELQADWPGAKAPSQATLIARAQEANVRFVVADDTGTIRGFAMGELRPDGRWQIPLVVADKTLSAATRIVHFKKMMRWLADNTPLTTKVMGRVILGRSLDNAMISLLPNRMVFGDGTVEYNTTSAEMRTVF